MSINQFKIPIIVSLSSTIVFTVIYLVIRNNKNQPTPATQWKYSDWSACNVPCGTGVQTRTFSCVDSMGKSVDNSNCGNKPTDLSKSCIGSNEPCGWVTGNWQSTPV